MDSEPLTEVEQDFSLVRGGPLYRFLMFAKLLHTPLEWLPRRIVACVLVTWFPLAGLTLLAGTFAGGVDVPFVEDLSNLRFLVAVPMLLAAELIVHQRVKTLVSQFINCDLLQTSDRPRFEAVIVRTMRLRNSAVVELAIVLLAYTCGSMVWRSYGTLPGTTWYSTSHEGTMTLTLAGHWLAWISLPLARFVILRWYYRIFIWYLFLWQVSRFTLKLNPLHPDRAGGLGFLESSAVAFAPVLTAQSIFFSAMIGNQIWHAGSRLPDFQLVIIGFVLSMLLLVLFPLLFFTRQMMDVKFEATHAFAQLSSHYVNAFRQKWLTGSTPENEELLGVADIQSLADLAGSFDVVDGMRVVPFSKSLLLKLAIVICVPLLPLVLTMIPLNELMTRLIQLLM